MQRTVVTLLALAAVALVAAQTAAAKEGANLTSYPTSGMKAGSPWHAQFEAFSHDGNAVTPAILIRDAGGSTERFDARRTSGTGAGTPESFRASVVFPAAGNWTYGVELRPGGPVQWFEDSPVAVAPAPIVPSPDGRLDVPRWLVALLGAIVLGAAAGFAARKHVRSWAAIALRQT